MKRNLMIIAACIAAVVPLLNSPGCTSVRTQSDIIRSGVFSPLTQEQVRRTASSVVYVGAIYNYSVAVFNYDLNGKRFVRDAKSQTEHRLAHDGRAITSADTSIAVHGAGIILYHDERRAVVLTSHHLLSSADTVDMFYHDSSGNVTSILFSRAIKTKSIFYAKDQRGNMRVAEVACTDGRSDLGLIFLEISQPLGTEFPFAVAYENELDWGDAVYVFGFPRQTKQVTFGMVSPTHISGNFVIDAVTGFGYSGGPILAVQPDGSLKLGGIMRAMTVDEINYVVPPPYLLPGNLLSGEDVAHLRTDRVRMIQSGTTFGIDSGRIGLFLTGCREVLSRRGIALARRLLPD
jgi:S1-C subfamily serine protease